jgi:hypothetical protein
VRDTRVFDKGFTFIALFFFIVNFFGWINLVFLVAFIRFVRSNTSIDKNKTGNFNILSLNNQTGKPINLEKDMQTG